MHFLQPVCFKSWPCIQPLQALNCTDQTESWLLPCSCKQLFASSSGCRAYRHNPLYDLRGVTTSLLADLCEWVCVCVCALKTLLALKEQMSYWWYTKNRFREINSNWLCECGRKSNILKALLCSGILHVTFEIKDVTRPCLSRRLDCLHGVFSTHMFSACVTHCECVSSLCFFSQQLSTFSCLSALHFL